MDDGGNTAANCMAGSFMMVGMVVGLACYVIMAYSLMVIAKKTGTENGWFAWIPILNIILMVNITQKPIWWVILFFIPLANIVAVFVIMMALAEVRGKPAWIGIVGAFLPYIVMPYLAFTD